MYKNIRNFISDTTINYLLLLILVVSIVFRFVGSTPGYPPYHSDEGISYSAAVSMIRNENLDPLRYDYPSIVPLVNYISYRTFFIPLSWTSYYVRNLGDFVDGVKPLFPNELEKAQIFQNEILGVRELNALSWGRYTTAFVGVGVVYLLYIVGSKLKGNRLGLLSALLLSVNYRHVLNSHLGLPDIYNAFFLLLSFSFSLNLLKDSSRKNYVLASVFAGLSFATKYQFFSFVPLLIIHLYLTWNQKTLENRLSYLFRREAILVPFIILFVFVILNPYAFVKIEETIAWLEFVASKYRSDKYSLDFFPYSYLYHWGIGKLTSILVLVGILLFAKRDLKTFVLPFGVVLAFLYITTYMTGGGFYTRNFVTIIPFLLLFAGYVLDYLFSRKAIVVRVLALVLLLISARENVSKSYVVAKEYRNEWNFRIVERWITDTIPEESRIAAHSSVPFNNNTYSRLPFEQNISFSIQEFMDNDADYAVMNMDWSTKDFYGWMTQDTGKSLENWNKPIHELEETYSALAIREFQDYVIFSEMNNPLAPDSSFLVAKIPRVTAEIIEQVEEYDFSGEGETSFRSFVSEPIQLNEVEGITLEIVGEYRGTIHDGFVFVELYENSEDAINQTNRIAVRLSSRLKNDGENTFSFKVPNDAHYAVISTGVYRPAQVDTYIKNIKVYSSNVQENFETWTPKNTELYDGLIFPNSHGNL